MSQKKIMLIDGSSLAFRAFYSILDLNRFQNKAGLHTNALFSFNRMLDNLLEQFEPTHVLTAFDKGKITFRTKKYSAYKDGRQKTPSEFLEQLPYFPTLLDAYGIKHYALNHYEADDIIGTLSAQADPDDEVIIVTGDKDLLQLAKENVTIYINRRGVSELEVFTPKTIEEEYQITPEQFIDLKGLMGDSSDNYPGVTRIGEKTGLKLLHQFKTLENLYENIDELKPSKMKENLENEKDMAFLCKELAEILTDAPIEIGLSDIKLQDKNIESLVDFYKQMDFNSFLSKVQEKYQLELDLAEKSSDSFTDYKLTELNEIEENHLPSQAALYFETLDDNYHFANIEAVIWSDIENKQSYITDAEIAFESSLFIDWLKNSQAKKITLDSKRDQVLVNRHGGHLNGISFDVLIANYLIDTHHANEVADIVEAAGLNYQVLNDEMVYGKGVKKSIPEDKEKFYNHLNRKITALSELENVLIKQLEESEMKDLYFNIEFPLAFVLTKMEIQGIKVHRETLEEKNKEMLERLSEMEKKIYDLSGETFNLNSPKQLGEVLFEKLELPVIKRTKTGYSTAADVLEKLKDTHPIIEKILDYRQLAKLQGTYLAGLPKYVKEDGKIHTRFIQTLTQTGRLSSADPNLQNIPIRIEEGRRIRQAFVPSYEGWQFIGADYSQIELRVLAHISNDEHLRQAFLNHEDIHASTARRVLGVGENKEVSSNERRQAKAVNFGIVYGISDYGLSQNLNITRKEAKHFIDTYFEKYPGVHKYMVNIVKEAKEKGYVSTLFHRRRYLPDINNRNFNLRSFAERTAINSPIQGTAADIIKIAMIRLQEELEKRELKSRLILQVHDELILEGPSEEMPLLADLLPQVMEEAVKLSVPIEVDCNQGNNWYEL